MAITPTIPGTRIDFVGEQTPRIEPSLGATVALIVTHDWGPLASEQNAPELMTSFDEWIDRYGDSDTSARTAVGQAFLGQGLQGILGAGAVIPIRVASSSARRASATLRNANDPADDALTLTAIWAGTRGNALSVVVDDDPISPTERARLRVRFNATVVESFVFPKTDIARLAAAINDRSRWLRAEVITDGVALDQVAGVSLTGGDDGSSVTASDILAGLGALEFRPFSILSVAVPMDDPIHAAVLEWVRAQAEAMRPVMWVLGGDGEETLDDAIARSAALEDPHVVNLGCGLYRDETFDKHLSTAELAPRIAGVLAARGRRQSLTAAEFGGLYLVGNSGLTVEEIEVAIERGVTVLMRTESPDADLRIAKGVTTFTDTGDPRRPLEIFSDPRLVRIMDLYIRALRMWGDRVMIGNVPVNDDSRDAVRQYGNMLIDELLSEGLILTRAQGASIDPFIETPVTTDDTLPFRFGWQFARTLNFIIGEGKVR